VIDVRRPRAGLVATVWARRAATSQRKLPSFAHTRAHFTCSCTRKQSRACASKGMARRRAGAQRRSVALPKVSTHITYPASAWRTALAGQTRPSPEKLGSSWLARRPNTALPGPVRAKGAAADGKCWAGQIHMTRGMPGAESAGCEGTRRAGRPVARGMRPSV
jgi:hypothetical protein